jgi:hypothetical protein
VTRGGDARMIGPDEEENDHGDSEEDTIYVDENGNRK